MNLHKDVWNRSEQLMPHWKFQYELFHERLKTPDVLIHNSGEGVFKLRVRMSTRAPPCPWPELLTNLRGSGTDEACGFSQRSLLKDPQCLQEGAGLMRSEEVETDWFCNPYLWWCRQSAK